MAGIFSNGNALPAGAVGQIVGPERGERVSQLD